MTTSPSLKEIAGRLQKLSYRDMSRLASLIQQDLAVSPDIDNVVSALLSASDQLAEEH